MDAFTASCRRSSARSLTLPNIASRSTEELLALLESDNGTLRDMAQQEILQRGDKSVAESLRSLVAASKSPQARVHALWMLNALKELQNAELRSALADQHPGVVRNAILLVEPRIGKSEILLKTLCNLVDQTDAHVRLQLALTLGESKAPAAGVALGKLVPHAVSDPWLAQGIVSSSKHHSLAVLEQFLSYLTKGDLDATTKSRQVSTIADLIATAKANGADYSKLVARTITSAEPDASWVFALAAACASSADAKANPDPAFRNAILTVYQKAKSLSADKNAAPSLRSQALQLFGLSLGKAEQERVLLSELLSPTTELEVQLAALERLVAFHDRESSEHLLSRWPNLSYSLRDAAAMQLVSNSVSTEVLLEQLESGAILPGDLSPAVRQTLRQSGSQSTKTHASRVLGKTAAANQELVQRYLEFQQDASQAADVSRGQELFRKHCAVCHLADAMGLAAGPNLTNLTDRSRSALTESILVPNRAFEPQYRGYIAVLSNGRVLSGAVADEAGDTVTLALADGKRAMIKRSEIEEFRDSGISLMPDGFQQELDPRMLYDLVEYLRSDEFLQSLPKP